MAFTQRKKYRPGCARIPTINNITLLRPPHQTTHFSKLTMNSAIEIDKKKCSLKLYIETWAFRIPYPNKTYSLDL